MIGQGWRDIPGYAGLYQVSDAGKVRSVDREVSDGKGGKRKLKGQTLMSAPSSKGYHTVALCKNGVQKTHNVHRLVAETFLGTCPEGEEVCHSSNGKSDNTATSLRYGTRSDNLLDKRIDGTHRGRKVVRSDGAEFINMSEAAEETGCRRAHIWRVCNNRRNTAGGFGWQYARKEDK